MQERRNSIANALELRLSSLTHQIMLFCVGSFTWGSISHIICTYLTELLKAMQADMLLMYTTTCILL